MRKPCKLLLLCSIKCNLFVSLWSYMYVHIRKLNVPIHAVSTTVLALCFVRIDRLCASFCCLYTLRKYTSLFNERKNIYITYDTAAIKAHGKKMHFSYHNLKYNAVYSYKMKLKIPSVYCEHLRIHKVKRLLLDDDMPLCIYDSTTYVYSKFYLLHKWTQNFHCY